MDQTEYLLEREEAELGLLRPTGPDAMLSWQADHPGSCPMCGRPYSVHEELGGCPYYYPELEEADDVQFQTAIELAKRALGGRE